MSTIITGNGTRAAESTGDLFIVVYDEDYKGLMMLTVEDDDSGDNTGDYDTTTRSGELRVSSTDFTNIRGKVPTDLQSVTVSLEYNSGTTNNVTRLYCQNLEIDFHPQSSSRQVRSPQEYTGAGAMSSNQRGAQAQ